MERFAILVLFVLFVVVSCDKPAMEKPKNLIKEKQMVDMLVDIHLAEATFNNRRYQDSLLLKSSSADFYYSVLAKYGIPDSLFEKSFIYYTGNPKNFEKMYRQITNKLSEMEQEFSGRKNELLEFNTQE